MIPYTSCFDIKRESYFQKQYLVQMAAILDAILDFAKCM